MRPESRGTGARPATPASARTEGYNRLAKLMWTCAGCSGRPASHPTTKRRNRTNVGATAGMRDGRVEAAATPDRR
jgi:hypothetical protein